MRVTIAIASAMAMMALTRATTIDSRTAEGMGASSGIQSSGGIPSAGAVAGVGIVGASVGIGAGALALHRRKVRREAELRALGGPGPGAGPANVAGDVAVQVVDGTPRDETLPRPEKRAITGSPSPTTATGKPARGVKPRRKGRLAEAVRRFREGNDVACELCLKRDFDGTMKVKGGLAWRPKPKPTAPMRAR